MVDEFMVCVDRIIASACFESRSGLGGGVGGGDGGFEGQRGVGGGYAVPQALVDGGGGEEGCSEMFGLKSKKKREKGGGGGEVLECRICQEEGEDSDMEAPCACNGTLKFAHRKCIQRWCNKKGDITCEICNQVYAPDYTIPPSRAISDCIAIDIRHGWGPQIDVNDPNFLAMAAAEQQLLHAGYEDYAAANNNSIACCRSIALILMLLLLIRHALMVTVESGMIQDASAFFNVSLLQLAGFILPCYVIVRSCYVIQSRRRRQEWP